ncbi:L10-interacting MYB domain-containing protein-like [Malania oleifera]|uniref:L10-interacting MYB domain-containing protein-like n=1 Tax=Malania oleifera TaxID=397392 RepID=UPI0025AE499B|nr:L10-interacting MYB domain-containing protein-like [Malania oleifera]
MTVKRNGGDKDDFEPDPATWTALEEKIFIQLMVKEVHKGNRSTTTFSRKGWKHIEQEFVEKTRKRYNNSQFRNKFNQLRTRFHDFSKLLKEPGVSYDSLLNTICASENVWESCIKANKGAKRFRKKGCPMYIELGIIFGDPAAKFKYASPLALYSMDDEDKLEMEDASTNATPSAFQCKSSDAKDYPSQSVRRRRERSPTPTSHVQGKREARTTETGETLKEWAEVTNTRTPTLSNLEASPQSSTFSITNCVKCLESIEGVDGNTYVKAIKMFKDVDWREMFMAMSEERKLVWLASLE